MKPIFQNPIVRLVKTFSRTERLVFYSALIVLVVSGLTYSVLALRTQTYNTPSYGGTYREGVIGQPSFINPIIPSTPEIDPTIARLVFSSLLDMAETIRSSDDGLVWNVRLEDGITWHDGEKLTSEDIIFTVDVIKNPESRSPLNPSFQGVNVRRVSELEVEFSLPNPYAFFEEEHLASLRPIPKHIFESLPVSNYKLTPYGLNPVGSGPYKISSHDRNPRGFITELTLESNDDYFTKPAFIENFVFKFFQKDSELIRAYNVGQIDGFGLATTEPLLEKEVIIRHTPHYLNSSRYYAVFINQSVAPPELQNLSVRQALASSVSRSKLVEEVFDSHAIPFFAPTNFGDALSQGESASTELEGLELSLVVPNEPFLVKTAESLQRDWGAAGATVNLDIKSLRDIQEDVLRNTSYEMILFGNIVKESNDLFAFWHSSKRFFPDQNLALYQDEQTDELLEEYRSTFSLDARREILEAISKRIASDVPAVFLYSPQYVYITTPSLGGFDDINTINTSDDRFDGVTDWFVNSRRTFRKPVEATEGLL